MDVTTAVTGTTNSAHHIVGVAPKFSCGYTPVTTFLVIISWKLLKEKQEIPQVNLTIYLLSVGRDKVTAGRTFQSYWIIFTKIYL